jgi:precorrin-2/cobalt-factor-2 C20-methyltransferase
MKRGRLFGIGVGPGDPELITLKAYRILQESPVIAFPQKRTGEASYAYSIIRTHLDPSEKELLGLVFPMTKQPDLLKREWTKTVLSVWQKLSEGKDVAFITEGDPLLYSTFIHLSRQMKRIHLEVEIITIPGISSINAAAARLQLPLADGDEQIAIVPAVHDPAALRKAVREHDTVVFLKIAKVLPVLLDLLEQENLLDKAMIISKATSSEEEIWEDLRQLRGKKLPYLSLMVVKK